MNKRISLKAHLSGEQIETRYRKAKDAVERSHWQIIWLLAQGKTAQQIAEVTGYSYDWIRCIVHRYNQGDRQLWVIVVMTIPVAASSCQLSNKRSCNGLWMSRQPMTVSGAADIRGQLDR